MNPTQARQLIKDTFTQPFDRKRFGKFAANLLNHVDGEKKGAMAVNYGGHYSNDKTNICVSDDPEAVCAVLAEKLSLFGYAISITREVEK